MIFFKMFELTCLIKCSVKDDRNNDDDDKIHEDDKTQIILKYNNNAVNIYPITKFDKNAQMNSFGNSLENENFFQSYQNNEVAIINQETNIYKNNIDAKNFIKQNKKSENSLLNRVLKSLHTSKKKVPNESNKISREELYGTKNQKDKHKIIISELKSRHKQLSINKNDVLESECSLKTKKETLKGATICKSKKNDDKDVNNRNIKDEDIFSVNRDIADFSIINPKNTQDSCKHTTNNFKEEDEISYKQIKKNLNQGLRYRSPIKKEQVKFIEELNFMAKTIENENKFVGSPGLSSLLENEFKEKINSKDKEKQCDQMPENSKRKCNLEIYNAEPKEEKNYIQCKDNFDYNTTIQSFKIEKTDKYLEEGCSEQDALSEKIKTEDEKNAVNDYFKTMENMDKYLKNELAEFSE